MKKLASIPNFIRKSCFSTYDKLKTFNNKKSKVSTSGHHAYSSVAPSSHPDSIQAVFEEEETKLESAISR